MKRRKEGKGVDWEGGEKRMKVELAKRNNGDGWRGRKKKGVNWYNLGTANRAKHNLSLSSHLTHISSSSSSSSSSSLSLCITPSGHVDKLATEPFLLLHGEHGTSYRRS